MLHTRLCTLKRQFVEERRKAFHRFTPLSAASSQLSATSSSSMFPLLSRFHIYIYMDLIIATYPKAGTTWTQEVYKRALTQVRMPFLEMTSLDGSSSGMFNRTKNWLLEVMDPPRVIKTHLPIQLVPRSFWDAGCYTVHMARNPKGTVVSYYHFDRMNLHQLEPGPWPQYLEKFMSGQLGWGSWYDHVKGYWRERHNKKILYIFYEDMKLPTLLNSSDGSYKKISAMRENPMANYSTIPDTIFDRTNLFLFYFIGEAGDWKNHFSAEEDAAFEEHDLKIMADCPIPIRFTI
uniref:Sulfotransferase n=1 Tax=Sinocyclocheilus grahami TaxID=75366 RepID=A0A672LLP5_SINGR